LKVIEQRPKRLSPEERKRTLLEKAIDYFSEEGFEGGTRELARQLGITQPLIYRYFSTKADLINEVYHAVYVSQWDDGWARTLQTRDRPLRERLRIFYEGYTSAIFNRRWMRIFFFAGLKGLDINKRYIARVSEHLLRPICREMRVELGFDDKDRPLTQDELDLVWMMHGIIFYQGIREHIYKVSDPVNHPFSIEVAIDMYVTQAKGVVTDVFEGGSLHAVAVEAVDPTLLPEARAARGGR
jgi:AcrR family transcriptional regulator